MPYQPSPDLFDTHDAARFLCTTPRNLRRWVDKGLVPVIRLSPRVLRFDPDDLRRWVASRKQTAAQAFNAARPPEAAITLGVSCPPQ